ncbi:MAG: STAS domain-containing protein [bacterium]
MNIAWRKEVLLDILEIRGRIDGLTAAEIKRAFDQAVSEGQRHLMVDFTGVSYMSSAGLRIILQTHKSLNVIGGELILFSIPPPVAEIFRVSGLAPMLHIFQDLAALRKHLNVAADDETGTNVEFEGISFEKRVISGESGYLFPYGSPEKLMDSSYSTSDIIRVDQSEIAYGAGISALGDDVEDFRDLFGESVFLNHHFFSYPAVRRPTVDYSYFTRDFSHKINFLHGFGIHGNFSGILHFGSTEERITLSRLAKAAGNISRSNVFGMVLLALSGGILGMHLKRSPVIENQSGGKQILAPDSFDTWMSYPLEEEAIHKTVVGAGIVVKEPGKLTPEWKRLFPKEGDLHFHAAVFENGLWSNKMTEFEQELERVLKDFEVEKVVHLLPASVLLSGFIGVINLENI